MQSYFWEMDSGWTSIARITTVLACLCSGAPSSVVLGNTRTTIAIKLHQGKVFSTQDYIASQSQLWLWMQGAEGEQREDVGHQQKALVDMWVLSLSDILLTSHMSTFGYTAQGLGGLTPYHLKPWLDNACWLSVSSDPCFHFAPRRVECPGDNFTMKSPLKEAPYVTKCPDLPDTGIQLAEWALGRHVDGGPLVTNGLFQKFQSDFPRWRMFHFVLKYKSLSSKEGSFDILSITTVPEHPCFHFAPKREECPGDH